MRQQLGLLYQNFELVLYTRILGVLFQERTAHLRRCNLWSQFCQVNVRCCTVSGKGGAYMKIFGAMIPVLRLDLIRVWANRRRFVVG
jgi:hypothetical protein